MTKHIITSDHRPDVQWQALVKHAGRWINPPRGPADITPADVTDLIDTLNATGEPQAGRYEWDEHRQLHYTSRP